MDVWEPATRPTGAGRFRPDLALCPAAMCTGGVDLRRLLVHHMSAS